MTRRLAVVATLLAVFSLIVAACSTSENNDPDPTATMATGTSPAGATTAATDPQAPVPSATASLADAASTVTAEESPTTVAPTATRPPIPEGTATVAIGDQMLTVPAGYTISVFADDLGAARFMALDDDGGLYVTDRGGRVLRLPDANGDGVADSTDTVLDGLNNPHGISFYEGALYVADETRVIRATDDDGDGVYENIVPIIDDLPEGGHWSRTIRFGPDGTLYVSVGSSCNVCDEEDPRRAAVWRYNADGSGGEPFATGLRNAVGLTFHPDTGELWTSNNGRDGMGDDVPPETINQPNQGDDFGWPRCHAGDIVDPEFGSEGACDGTAQPAVLMQAHSAPLGLTFASGEQLAPFDGDLLVAFHGSWNREEPTGYKVVRVPFQNGAPTGEVIDFVSGWLLADGNRWGRPVDVIVASDGSLMISDDEAGRIFRLTLST